MSGCIRQTERQMPSSSYNHNTLTTLRTSVMDSLKMYFKLSYEVFRIALGLMTCRTLTLKFRMYVNIS